MKKKMKLNYTIVNSLMDTLAQIYISAHGCPPFKADGDSLYTDYDTEAIYNYANEKSLEILKSWVDEEHEWEIVIDNYKAR